MGAPGNIRMPPTADDMEALFQNSDVAVIIILIIALPLLVSFGILAGGEICERIRMRVK